MSIIVIGSLNVDNTYRVSSFLLPGETKPSLDYHVYAGGKGLNQAVAASRAGARVRFAGLFGTGSGILEKTLRESGVDLSLMEKKDKPAGHTVIEVDDKGQNCILLYGGTNRMLTPSYVSSVLGRAGKNDIVLLQNETNLVPEIIEEASRRGLRVAFNASPADSVIARCPLGKVTWLFVNEIEASQIAGEGAGNDPVQLLDCLRERYPRVKVVLTLGGGGLIYGDGEETIRLGVYDGVRPVDSTGAGDTFTGYFLAGIEEGLSAEESLCLGTAASAVCITRPGASLSIPLRSDVEKAVESASIGCLAPAVRL